MRHLKEIFDRPFDDDICSVCYADISGGESHYHCPRCKAVVSMIGHSDCQELRRKNKKRKKMIK
jgi:hypothetical protein